VATTWVALHLTERCGLSCLHCLRDPSVRAADLPVATLARVLDEAVALHRIEHVALTGGEPVTHPDLPGVVEAITSRGLKYHLVTSGVGFDRLLAILDRDPAARAALTRVNVSVDGATEGTHDAIRGPGAWRHAMAAIAATRARDVPLGLQMTVNALNQAEMEQAALAFAELGADRVVFAMTQATGTPADARLHLSPREWGRVRERVERLTGVLRIPVTAAEGFARPQPFHTCAPFGSEMLHVDPHGRLTLCCQHSGIPGGADDLAVDLAATSLAEAHARLLEVVHRYQAERLRAAAAGRLGPWDLFPCNACLRRFGKPHWTDQGAAGPRARRAEGEEGGS
jgi:MoaA/NifB/PqqE/SkfB family radical SAM enzyme